MGYIELKHLTDKVWGCKLRVFIYVKYEGLNTDGHYLYTFDLLNARIYYVLKVNLISSNSTPQLLWHVKSGYYLRRWIAKSDFIPIILVFHVTIFLLN